MDFNQTDRYHDLKVGAIILATGFKDYDAARSTQFGYGQLDGVLTSMEFERLINSGGPTSGRDAARRAHAAPYRVYPLRRQPGRSQRTLLEGMLYVLAEAGPPGT